MYIKEIEKYDENGPYTDANIIVSDGEFDLLCYTCPCVYNVGDTDFTITAFECDNITISNKREYKIQKSKDSFYAYKLQGQLINIDDDEGVVQIGSIIINAVNWIPRDIKVGEFIEFTVIRLDID